MRLLRLARELSQELRELGPAGTLFRLGWELRVRSPWERVTQRLRAPGYRIESARGSRLTRLFTHGPRVKVRLAGHIGMEALPALEREARIAVDGVIRCFRRWDAAFGRPIDWHLNPLTGVRWNDFAHWTRVLKDAGQVGDAKVTLECGRFPHAYALGRAAAFSLVPQDEALDVWFSQARSFSASNPVEVGVHWHTAQETAIRLIAWKFLVDALSIQGSNEADLDGFLRASFLAGTRFVERQLPYSRHAVYNNHLLAEALLIYLTGVLLSAEADAPRWRSLGEEILEEQAVRQFYADGGYLQQSHNYHRTALQWLLLYSVGRSIAGVPGSETTRAALERSVDFLTAIQNPADGRLPNYGSNDGSLPLVLSTCDFSDFRPTLQAASIVARGTRLYPEGPWDEEAAWLLGPEALDAPLAPPRPTSRTFSFSGHQVLRGIEPGSFGALRCGTLRDRFSQIDMLHLDVWWRGLNVLVDGGSYLYNGPAKWHNHFVRTASHNTLTVDGLDQMVHHRKFKVLYWTQAEQLAFRDNQEFALVAGEHLGYQRRLGCVHRRSVLFVKDELWVVADSLLGSGQHAARLHWLGSACAHAALEDGSGMRLDTAVGSFFVRAFSQAGQPLAGDVVAGREEPPRGWLSRYYGEKIPAPSFAVEQRVTLPWTCISLLAGAEEPLLTSSPAGMRIRHAGREVAFTLAEGLFEGVEVA